LNRRANRLNSIVGEPVKQTRWILAACLLGALTFACAAQPVIDQWPGGAGTVATAAAALGGAYASADAGVDEVQIRDVNRTLIRTIARSELTALLPWMDLSPSPDGPSGLGFSDSGRLLFILVHDANAAPDGLPSDAVLRFDTGTDQLSLFTRLELFDSDAQAPYLALAHNKGRLFVGTFGFGGPGSVRVYRATANDTTGVLLSNTLLPGGTTVRGLAIDRTGARLYAASDTAIYRASLPTLPLAFSLVGVLPDARGLAWSDNYGSFANTGLYALSLAPPGSQLTYISPPQSQGTAAFSPMSYLSVPNEWRSLCATADGKLLAAADTGAVEVSDQSDTRLTYQAWLRDEFSRVVQFAKGLVSPDGEPAGWVIDADAGQGQVRFHPATPDAAAWAILLLLMNDELNGDPSALPLVRQILVRYSGLAPDGIGPSVSADGVMRHWIDPYTGQAKPGWSSEFATISTMNIVLAAARAAARFPGDSQLQQAASRIICRFRAQDSYLSGDFLSMRALPSGGPDFASTTRPFNEAILVLEQFAGLGGSASATAYARWMERWRWPTATYLTGRPVTGDVGGQFQSAFTSLYPFLLSASFRASSEWRQQVANALHSNNAWTDDNGPRFNTVFSAGTTRSDWGGYRADSLSSHPGDVTTLTALMAFSASGGSDAAVAAYNAYRRAARQTFASGASVLYRRSDVDPAYRPDSAGLPDVALGALGLAELIRPGSVQAVLTGGYPACPCYANCDGSSAAPILNVNDFVCFLNRFAQADPWANCDGSTVAPALNVNDFTCFLNRYAAGCP
jgi:hypothetical protein